MSDDTRTYHPDDDDDSSEQSRRTGQFGYVEPGTFDPRPPLPEPPPPPPPVAVGPRGRQVGLRVAALGLVAVALLAAIGFEGPTRRPSSAAATTTTAPPAGPAPVGAGAQSPKAFYCVEGAPRVGVDAVLVLVNRTRSETPARLPSLVSGGNPPAEPVRVAPGTRQTVSVNARVPGATGVGALVEADAPGLAGSETPAFAGETPKGPTPAACAAQVGPRWCFAAGTPAPGA